MRKKTYCSLLFFLFITVNFTFASNALFKNEFGNWNDSANWKSGHIPASEKNVVVSNGKTVLINAGQNKCNIIYCGLSGKEIKWGKIVLKKGGNLNASCLVLGKNKGNSGIFLIAGGKMKITKFLHIGDAEGKTTGNGELFLTAGKLKMADKAPAFVGYKGKGDMVVSWKGIFEANDITISEFPGTQGSALKIIGGKVLADNITINCVDAKIPSRVIISGGKAGWKNLFTVSGVLKIENSSPIITCNLKNGTGLSLRNGSILKYEFGAKGIAAINLQKSKIGIAKLAKLKISGTYYTRSNGKPGTFLLIKHNGYADQKSFSKVELTGFGNLVPSLKYEKNAIYLELKLKPKSEIVNRANQGIFMKYWELPMDADCDKTVIFPPLTYMPDFTNTLIRTHPIFGKAARKIDLSELSRKTNILVQFKGLISIPKTGKYTFWIKYNEAVRLKIDENCIGKDKPGESTIVLNLTNGMHEIEVGYYENSMPAELKVCWSGPGFAKEEISEESLFIPDPPKGFTKFYGFGNIMPDDERIYNYCPSFIFDEEEGLYKFWSGGAGAGDFILYKEAPTIDGLKLCPTLNQLHPLHNGKFDEIHCCDPNVFLDNKGTFYLTYTGCSDGNPLVKASRIGMAISYNRGRSWKRLHNGDHIIGPKIPKGAYGTGQSAAVHANDGYYYMAYTDADKARGGTFIDVIRCTDPSFPSNKFELITNKLKLGASVDLVYDAEKEEFIVVGEGSPNPNRTSNPYVGVKLVYFDKNWKKLRTVYLKADASWTFGEGVSFLSNMKKNPLKYSYHENEAYVFAAATHEYKENTRLWAAWVEGDTKYIMFHIPENKDTHNKSNKD